MGVCAERVALVGLCILIVGRRVVVYYGVQLLVREGICGVSYSVMRRFGVYM